MHKKKSVWQKCSLYGALFGALALASATAHADQFGLQIAQAGLPTMTSGKRM
ncbi:MAG: hypothetical protein CBARDMAM_0813 [uncultured Caballeronia sp.]|nr:MAG: hypothetical protein CBARDMAM_0813 [uncultured Caballeronia sp.]